MIYFSECSLIYNRKDDRFYIYNGEDYVYDTKDEKEAYEIFHKMRYKNYNTNQLMPPALYKQLDDKTWWGEIPSCKGVWANEFTKEECERVLQEVYDDWLTI